MVKTRLTGTQITGRTEFYENRKGVCGDGEGRKKRS